MKRAWILLLTFLGTCVILAPAEGATARQGELILSPTQGPVGTTVEVLPSFSCGAGTSDGSGGRPQTVTLSWSLGERTWPAAPKARVPIEIPEEASGTITFSAVCDAPPGFDYTGDNPNPRYTAEFQVTSRMTVTPERDRARPGETVAFTVENATCPFTLTLGGSSFPFETQADVSVKVPDRPGPTQASVHCTSNPAVRSLPVDFTIDGPEISPGPGTGGPTQGASPRLALSPAKASPGERVRIVPAGFPPACDYSASLDHKKLLKLDGKLRFTVPEDTAAGGHTITVRCATRATALGGQPVVLTAAADIVRDARLTVLAAADIMPSEVFGPLDLDLAGLAAATAAVIVVIGSFLLARSLALRQGLIPEKPRLPQAGLPSDIFNKALESLNHRRKKENGTFPPWPMFFLTVAFIAAVQTAASPDARESGKWSADKMETLLPAFAVGAALVVLTYAAVAHWIEIWDLPGGFGEYRTLWRAVGIAVIMAVGSLFFDLNPGYAYGLIGFFVILETRGEPSTPRKLDGIVAAALTTYGASLACWWLWAMAHGPSLQLAGKTITFMVLETAVFALLPIPLLDGGELFQGRPLVWFGIFTPMLGTWFYLAWKEAARSPWEQVAKMVGTLVVVSVISYFLWKRAENEERERRAASVR